MIKVVGTENLLTTTAISVMSFSREVGQLNFSVNSPREECDVMLVEKLTRRLAISEEDLIEVVNKKTYKGVDFYSKVLIEGFEADNPKGFSMTVLGMGGLSYDKIGNEGHLILHVDSNNKRLLNDFSLMVHLRQNSHYLISYMEPIRENENMSWTLDIEAIPYYNTYHLKNLYVD